MTATVRDHAQSHEWDCAPLGGVGEDNGFCLCLFLSETPASNNVLSSGGEFPSLRLLAPEKAVFTGQSP